MLKEIKGVVNKHRRESGGSKVVQGQLPAVCVQTRGADSCNTD